MFEKTLSDIVKGIRASKRDTALYISQCIAEIKIEINSSDMFVKSNALQKLTFLQMMGYGMSWASFATIEVMSSPRFGHKRIGCLAASQGFTQDTDVILLTTNSLKKQLKSASSGSSMDGVYETGLAVNCVANIVTEELAQDLLPELTNLTSHPQPYLRKKAILCLFKAFMKYPQGLRLTFAQIQQCLGDSDPAVASCAVNVITELSDKNPRNYLHLAPAFFDLLTSSSNNWMLIKVVKLLGSLVQEEPRLARKLLEPLAQIVRSTPAKSLMFEAVHAITLCLPYCRKSDGSMPANVPEIVDLCANTLRDFVEEKDQNLKYLGLVGFSSLMQSHPKVLSAPTYRPLILTCLSDEDVTIRSRALGLLPGMASRKNLMELVKQLLQHVEYANGTYKLDLVAKIVEMCSGEKYALLQNFSWYLDTLFQLGHIRGLETHAEMLRSQVSDVALRVLPVRAYAVKRSLEILLEGEQRDIFSTSNVSSNSKKAVDGDNGRGRHIMRDILPSLAWIVGEYSDLFPDAISIDKDAVYIYNNNSQGPYHSVIQAITVPSSSIKLPPSTQKVYVQAALKVFAAAAGNAQISDAELEACCTTLTTNLQIFMQSTDVEVQERSFTLYLLIQSLNLTSSEAEMPALMNLTPDESDSSDDEAEGNLLEMPNSILPSLRPSKTSLSETSRPASTDGLASRCRSAAQTLGYLLKQSPMKPTSSKVQRKKHNTPIGIVDVDLHAPVNLSIFSSLIEEENLHRTKGRTSVEAITFTQQRSMADTANSRGDFYSTSITSPANPLDGSLLSEQQPSIQMYGGDQETQAISSKGGTRPASSNDPFYLNSNPSILDTEDTPDLPSRFGTIELGDVDSDEDVDGGKQKRRKHKKKKLKKQKANHIGGLAMEQGFGNVTVYGSDDDGDDEVKESTPRYRKPGREFDSLAKVDLTMPLREDEVMPERKHRVVPEKPTEVAQPRQFSDQQKAMKAKKKKKESKRSKKKKSKESNAVASSEGIDDLLNLGFAPSIPAPVPTQPLSTSPIMKTMGTQATGMTIQNQSNTISNAFNDLLGLADTTPAAPLPTPTSVFDNMNTPIAIGSPAAFSSLKNDAVPWIRANVKTSHATGSPVVDWTKIHVMFCVFRESGGVDGSSSLVIRADNHMESSMLRGLVFQLKDHGDTSIGDIVPGSSGESSKIGPFPNSSLKGSLVTPECSVPVKIALPVSTNFSPVKGLCLEDVAQQLSSTQWSSNSAKIEVSASSQPEKLKPVLCKFLNMEEVEPDSSGPLNGTFAGQSSDGAQIRVLVKVKQNSVKVDVKCTNPLLGKTISSDLRRLIL
jgi:AP-3 complex subunit delta-1